jgi:molecular chaperone HscB
MDYFAFFGLEPGLRIDLSDLEARFYRLSRQMHPDRFARAAPAERERAEQETATLNDGYRTLRDPVRRAEYVLAQAGYTASGRERQAPPELLEEVLEINEALDEYRMGDRAAEPRLKEARTRLRGALDESDGSLAALFEEYAGRGPAIFGELRATLDRRKYVHNLLGQVEGELTS